MVQSFLNSCAEINGTEEEIQVKFITEFHVA